MKKASYAVFFLNDTLSPRHASFHEKLIFKEVSVHLQAGCPESKRCLFKRLEFSPICIGSRLQNVLGQIPVFRRFFAVGEIPLCSEFRIP